MTSMKFRKGATNRQFEGIYTPVVTPYNADYSINRDAFAQAIEFLITSGVHELIIAGTTGEYYAQTFDERVELMVLGKQLINGRVPMIVGTGAIRTEDSILYAENAKRAGADALLIATPPYAYPTYLQATRADIHNLAQPGGRQHGFIFFDKLKPYGLWFAKNYVAFFNTSLSSRRSRFSLRSFAFSRSKPD